MRALLVLLSQPMPNDEVAAELMETIVTLIGERQHTTTFTSYQECVDSLSTDNLAHVMKYAVFAHVVLVLSACSLTSPRSYSRSDNVRVRIVATSLLCAVMLECNAERARSVQASALEWGTLLWHLQFSVEAEVGSYDLGSGQPPTLSSLSHYDDRWHAEATRKANGNIWTGDECVLLGVDWWCRSLRCYAAVVLDACHACSSPCCAPTTMTA